MTNKIILSVLIFAGGLFSVDRHFGEVLLLNKDTLNSPSYVVGFGPDGDTMRIVKMDSLGVTIGHVDSARVSGTSHNSDSLGHKPPSYYDTVGNGALGGLYLKLDQTTPQSVINGDPYFTSGLKTPNIYPNADGATALQIMKADGGTPVVNFNTTLGYMGIGTTSPLCALDIPKSQTNSSAKIGSYELQTFNVNNAWLGENTYYDGTKYVYRDDGYASLIKFLVGGFSLQTSASGVAGNEVTMAERMRMLNSGYVGFGTDTPVCPIDVPSSQINSSGKFGSFELQTYLVNNAWLGENVYFNGGYKYRAAGYAGLIKFIAGGLSFQCADVGVAGANATISERLRVLNNGNMGVGVADPDEKLEVSGNVRLTADNNVYYLGTAKDAGITYDGTNMVIDPDLVGTGALLINGAMRLQTPAVDNGADYALVQSSLTDTTVKKARIDSLSVAHSRVSDTLKIPAEQRRITFVDSTDSLLKLTDAIYHPNGDITFPRYMRNSSSVPWIFRKANTDQAIILGFGDTVDNNVTPDSGAYIFMGGKNWSGGGVKIYSGVDSSEVLLQSGVDGGVRLYAPFGRIDLNAVDGVYVGNFDTTSRDRLRLGWRVDNARSIGSDSMPLLLYGSETDGGVEIYNGVTRIDTLAVIDKRPTGNATYIAVFDTLNDTLKVVHIDSIVTGLSDSTKANAPHGVEPDYYTLSDGTNKLKKGKITDTLNATTVRDELDVMSGGNTVTLGANSGGVVRTDATLKIARVGSAHYTNSELPVGVFYAYNDENASTLLIGGGTSGHNAITDIRINTGATTTTPNGTTRFAIGPAGKIRFLTTPPTYNDCAILTRKGDTVSVSAYTPDGILDTSRLMLRKVDFNDSVPNYISGTTNYYSKFTGENTVGDGNIRDTTLSLKNYTVFKKALASDSTPEDPVSSIDTLVTIRNGKLYKKQKIGLNISDTIKGFISGTTNYYSIFTGANKIGIGSMRDTLFPAEGPAIKFNEFLFLKSVPVASPTSDTLLCLQGGFVRRRLLDTSVFMRDGQAIAQSQITGLVDSLDKHADTLGKYKDHASLNNLNSTNYTHLTAANHTDLTDAGASTLHYHASDRDRANHTGTQATSTIVGLGDSLSNHRTLINGKEPVITGGLVSQFWSGIKTWVTLNVAAVAGLTDSLAAKLPLHATADSSAKAPVTGANGYFTVKNSSTLKTVSSVDSTEFKYLDGVTSSIQAQLNNRATSSEATIACSIFDGATYRSWVSAKIVTVGKMCTIMFPGKTIGNVSGALEMKCNASLPEPSIDDQMVPITVWSETSSAYINSYVLIHNDSKLLTFGVSGANLGVYNSSFTYTTQ